MMPETKVGQLGREVRREARWSLTASNLKKQIYVSGFKPVVNFANILQTAFVPIYFHQKNYKTKKKKSCAKHFV